MSPTQGIHVNRIIGIQKLIAHHAKKTDDTVDTKCDKVDTVQTKKGTNLVLKDSDYDWWIKKDSSQAKRLQTAYLQDIKIHR
jgi:hypothetical protein